MELISTQVGRRLAQHPYNKAVLLHAGIEVSGEQHSVTIPFIQLVSVKCKRGIIWGELEFELPNDKVIRLHGTEWGLTQQFYHQLKQSWQDWSGEMSLLASRLLSEQIATIQHILATKKHLNVSDLTDIQQGIEQMFHSLPLLKQRLVEFENCAENYHYCQNWLDNGTTLIDEINQHWVEQCLQEHQSFFNTIEQKPLNLAQQRAVISPGQSSLILAGAGCGKTSVLVARVGWLLRYQNVQPEQILLLAFNRETAQEMKTRINKQLSGAKVEVKTFHALALDIIQRCHSKKNIKLTELETDYSLRSTFLQDNIQQLCAEKKSYANGWRHWLRDELNLDCDNEPQFWQNKQIMARVLTQAERWFNLLRSVTMTQAEICATLPDSLTTELQKQLRLILPLVKAWKGELKNSQTIDFAGLITQACQLLAKGKFKPEWQHILIDEFQDISPQRLALVKGLIDRSAEQPILFAVGDDWQTIYRFSGAELGLTTRFKALFEDSQQCLLETTYRFNQQLADISNRFIQQNPHQIHKTLRSEQTTGKETIVILPDSQLENLLDKLSGFVTPTEKIMVLARYRYLYPQLLDLAAKRWPKLQIEFMTIHSSKGLEADYVIVLGLQGGREGFPAQERDSLIEQALLPVLENYPNAEERRLLYVALTRAKKRVWLLENRDQPSIFSQQLIKLGAVSKRKP